MAGLAPFRGLALRSSLRRRGNRLYTLAGNHRGRDVLPMEYRNVVDAWVTMPTRPDGHSCPMRLAGSANASAISWRNT